MMNINLDDSEIKYKPNATTITNDSLNSFPNIKHFFENLVEGIPVKSKHVGRSYSYHNDIEKYRYYAAYSMFLQYFIRKHLSNQFNIEITDKRAEIILNHVNDYDILNEYHMYDNTKILHESIKEHYEIFKDSKSKALDIVKSIKIVSLSQLIYFRHPLPKHNIPVNVDNLKEIVRYLNRLPYKSVALNPTLDCEYFNAFCNLIFDNEIICQIKTSKYQFLKCDADNIKLRKFYQNIIYAFGFYKQTGKMIKKFQIYNPLLGDEFTIELKSIDFELFEKVLKRDVTTWSRMLEVEDKLILNMTLFEKETDEENKNSSTDKK